MSGEAAWRRLTEALERHADGGCPTHFWLRDDDAVAPTPALDRLLDIAGDAGVAPTLAVIPAHAGDALAVRLDAARDAAVAVHGWSHANHAPAGEKKQELGRHRPAHAVLGEVAAGFAKLRAAHGARFIPLLVPPWNRIDAALLPELPALGFTALSAFGTMLGGPLRTVNATLDILDWRNGARCRPHDELAEGILRQLGDGFGTASRPVGVLTHHLVHDAEAWAFLERLFAETSRRQCRWLSAEALFGAGGAPR